MDWGAIIGVATLALIAAALRLLWRMLVLLLVLGPPSYAGIVLGYAVGTALHDAVAGVVIAVIAAGLISDMVLARFRAPRSS